MARSQADSLRVRLFIQSSLAALHQLRWETLRDPEQDRPWLTDERIFFSRYLSSQDWRPVRSTELSGLQALVVVASPTNVAQYQPAGSPLAALDVEAELMRAREALADVALMELASGTPAAPTLSSSGLDPLRRSCHLEQPRRLRHHRCQ